MDFIDEKDGPLFRIGQKGDEIRGPGESRSGSDLQGSAKFMGKHIGKSGFPQTGWAIKKDMGKGFFQFFAGIHRDTQTIDHSLLAYHVRKASGPQRGVMGLVPAISGYRGSC